MELLLIFIMGVSIAAIPGPLFFKMLELSFSKRLVEALMLSLGDFLGNLFVLGMIHFIWNEINPVGYQGAMHLTGALILAYFCYDGLKRRKEIQMEALPEPMLFFLKAPGRFKFCCLGMLIAVSSPIVLTFWVSLVGANFSQPSIFSPWLKILVINLGFLAFDVGLIILSALIGNSINNVYNRYVSMVSSSFIGGFSVYYFFLVWS